MSKRKKYPDRKRDKYPDVHTINRGGETLTLLCIMPNGNRLYQGFLQLYVVRQ